MNSIQWIVIFSAWAGYTAANALYYLDIITRKASPRQDRVGLCEWCKTLIPEKKV